MEVTVHLSDFTVKVKESVLTKIPYFESMVRWAKFEPKFEPKFKPKPEPIELDDFACQDFVCQDPAPLELFTSDVSLGSLQEAISIVEPPVDDLAFLGVSKLPARIPEVENLRNMFISNFSMKCAKLCFNYVHDNLYQSQSLDRYAYQNMVLYLPSGTHFERFTADYGTCTWDVDYNVNKFLDKLAGNSDEEYLVEHNGYTILRLPKAIMDSACFGCQFYITVRASVRPINCLLYYRTLPKSVMTSVLDAINQQKPANRIDFSFNKATGCYVQRMHKYLQRKLCTTYNLTNVIAFLVISETELDLISVYQGGELSMEVSGFLAKSYMFYSYNIPMHNNKIYYYVPVPRKIADGISIQVHPKCDVLLYERDLVNLSILDKKAQFVSAY